MTEKLEYSAADMASAAAGGWRDGQRAAAEAAQSVPAGEREAVEVAQVVSYLSACADWYDPDAPHPGPPEPLMTVAQHNRILAAIVPAGCKVVPVELLEDLRDLAADAVELQRAAYAGYKRERLARMDKTVADASALLASAEGVKDE